MSIKLEILATPLDRPNFCRFTIAGVQLSTSEITFDRGFVKYAALVSDKTVRIYKDSI